MYQRYQNRATGTGVRGAITRIVRRSLPPMQGVRGRFENADVALTASAFATLSRRLGGGRDPLEDINTGLRRCDERALRRHLAHEVALADRNAEIAENIVRCRGVEIKVRHCEVI